jgi:hydroxylamine dehydrogenase
MKTPGMKAKRVRYIWIPIIFVLIAVPAGFYYVDWSKGGDGAGLYSRDWIPDAMFAYWNPNEFYDPVQSIMGTFKGEQCITCHQAVTPGIVKDWQSSRHSQTEPKVYCNDCHGSNHEDLHLPAPEVCGRCHGIQHQQFVDEKRYGFPSHALAMERALDAKHFVDKPKAEVTACLQCHSVASKCDSCHTRHKFSAAEARRPEACITCHSGPPHPDDETYFHSAHGQLYLNEGENWDWSKPLRKGNYKAPTCAYCHMTAGKHQVADKSLWKFGIKEVNPLSSGNEIKRKQWIKLCSDCHESDWSAQQLKALDLERKQAWSKLYQAEALLKDLRKHKLIYPSIRQRPPYPGDTADTFYQLERIGFYEGQASAFYNVSPIERDYFEMWYFANLAAYKGAAHGDSSFVSSGHAAMDKSLQKLKQDAATLRALGNIETDETAIKNIWLKGEYTEFNLEHN